jgi:hypothetical protein
MADKTEPGTGPADRRHQAVDPTLLAALRRALHTMAWAPDLLAAAFAEARLR